ncbi:MAG: ribosome-associated translation inhibitor RaiA [Actinomycetaceae bacterium]|nr:ribosome-associated translation inhibitor RaiA [Actinomycetaceae bacterium]MDU0969698.1 ribosome-associated translation inhibitor RaiA [Actinomycetaceae bacterium]
MDIIVKGRNAEIHPNFRDYVEEKLAKIEHFYPRAQRVEVEITHEPNMHQADVSERVEITVIGKGPIIRAEAASSDRYASVDIAAGKLYERVRRARDRAKEHRRRNDRSLHEASDIDIEKLDLADARPAAISEDNQGFDPDTPRDRELGVADEVQLGDSPVLVRQKLHEAKAMTVSEALYQMELVGHPFFLFIDSETKQPCAVYHRRGWTYGVIRLDTTTNI